MIRKTPWPLAVVCLGLGALGGSLLSDGLRTSLNPVIAQNRAAREPAIPSELTSYRGIVKMVLPSVVSIDSRVIPKPRKPRPRNNLPPGFGFPDDLFPQQAPMPGGGFGSGVVVDADGVILTNFHVIEGADEAVVQLMDGRKYTSRDILGDRKTDLAIVRIKPGKPLPALQLGDSDQMEVGDRVLAIGAPFGLTGSVTHGIISAKSRNLRLNQYEDFLQTDAAINPGNSGGPLVNLEGKLIGINSAIKSRSGGFQGVGLAIASNLARDVMKQLLTNGLVRRGYIGVQIADLDGEWAEKIGLNDTAGVVITRVMAESPAEKGGLKANDVVRSIAGKPVKDGRELQRIVASLPLNQPTPVRVLRNGKPVELKLTVEEQPEEFGLRVPRPVDE